MNRDATIADGAEPGDEGADTGHGSLALPGLWLLRLRWEAGALVEVDQLEREAPPPLSDAQPIPARFAEPLLAFARGEALDLAQVPVTLRGTKFQRRVWAALRRVPRGSVRTYAGIAADVGSPRAMRAVGTAMAANPLPLVVPCHRVVAHGLRLGGYSGGVERKKALLRLEGVRVEGDLVLPGQLPLL